MNARDGVKNRRRMPALAALLALVLALFPAGNAAAEDLEAILRDLAAGARKTRSIESSFTQTRYVSFMDEKLVSEGFFIFNAPDRLIWQYDRPALFRLEYSGGKASFHSEVEGRANSSGGNSREESLAAMVGEQIMLWVSMDLERIEKNYAIELESSTPLTLKLTPKTKPAASPILYLRLTFGQDRRDVRQVYMQEEDGDYTSLEFYDSKRVD